LGPRQTLESQFPDRGQPLLHGGERAAPVGLGVGVVHGNQSRRRCQPSHARPVSIGFSHVAPVSLYRSHAHKSRFPFANTPLIRDTADFTDIARITRNVCYMSRSERRRETLAPTYRPSRNMLFAIH